MPYKAGIIGCGGIAGLDRTEYCHAEAYQRHPDTELVTAYDIDDKREKRFREQWKLFKHRGLLVDIVSICTPDETHVEYLEICLELPIKAVWCEKPISRNYKEAYAIARKYEDAGIALCVNYQRRWAEKFQVKKVKEISIDYTGSLWLNGCHGVDLILYLLGFPDDIDIIQRQKGLVDADLCYGHTTARLRGLDLPEFHFEVRISHEDGQTEAINEMYDLYPVLDDIVNDRKLRSNGFSAARTTKVCQWLMEQS